MLLDHIHFYVQNATKTRNWFMEKMGFQQVSQVINEHTHTEIITHSNSIFFLISSAVNTKSPAYHYLNQFASGVADVAFQVDNIDIIIEKLSSFKDYVLNHPQIYVLPQGKLRVAKIRGWNSLEHTLIENNSNIPFAFLIPYLQQNNQISQFSISNIGYNLQNHPQFTTNNDCVLTSIDHVVLNVAQGKLTEVVNFYQKILGFKKWQQFKIKTDKSGLFSQALIFPKNNFYFNVNEPTSDNSQIQEFIDFNGGSGIQHIALHVTDIINAVTEMRRKGLQFLPMSNVYYSKLKKDGRNGVIPDLTTSEYREIEKQQILIDCHNNIPESLLMQIFTKPIFNQPTFFFELIERRKQAQGFGEGNFQTLFELIEKQKIAEI